MISDSSIPRLLTAFRNSSRSSGAISVLFAAGRTGQAGMWGVGGGTKAGPCGAGDRGGEGPTVEGQSPVVLVFRGKGKHEAPMFHGHFQVANIFCCFLCRRKGSESREWCQGLHSQGEGANSCGQSPGAPQSRHVLSFCCAS